MGGCSRCRDTLCVPFFSLEGLQPKAFFTSQWDDSCKAAHILYVIYRVVIATLMLVALLFTGLVQNYSDGVQWFIYLTNWSFLLLCLDTLVQSGVVGYGIRLRRRLAPSDWDLHFPTLPWYVKFEWVLTDIATAAGFLVSILFWTVVYDSSKTLVPLTMVTHVGNSCYLLVNLWLTGMPARLNHVLFPLVYCAVYLGFSVVYQRAFLQDAIYAALDWSQPSSAGLSFFLFGLCGTVVVWVLVVLVTELRVTLYGCCHHEETYKILQDEEGAGTKSYGGVDGTE